MPISASELKSAERIRVHATVLNYLLAPVRLYLPAILASSSTALKATIAELGDAQLGAQRLARMLAPGIVERTFEPMAVFESAVLLNLVGPTDKLRGVVGETISLLESVRAERPSMIIHDFAQRIVTVREDETKYQHWLEGSEPRIPWRDILRDPESPTWDIILRSF